MKKLFFIMLFTILIPSNLMADKKCADMLGSKTINKDSPEYIKCVAKKAKETAKKGIGKLNTDSKATDWVKKVFF